VNIDICYDLDGKQYLIHVNQLSNAAETPSKFTTFVVSTKKRQTEAFAKTSMSMLIRETTSFQEGTQLQTLFSKFRLLLILPTSTNYRSSLSFVGNIELNSSIV
jgi:hypothetical protein